MRVRYRATALEDVDEIYLWRARQSTNVAEKVEAAVLAAAEWLGEHPEFGTMTDQNGDEPMFPNASYVISAAEWNFWMADDVASRLPENRQNFAPGAKRNLSRIKDKPHTINAGEDIVTGIRALDTSGTPRV